MTDTPTERETESTWTRLGRRKVVQWGVVYIAAAWGFLQGLEYVSGTYDWPRQIQQLTTLAFLIGLSACSQPGAWLGSPTSAAPERTPRGCVPRRKISMSGTETGTASVIETRHEAGFHCHIERVASSVASRAVAAAT